MRRYLNYLLLISIPLCAALLVYGYYAQSDRISRQARYAVYLLDARSSTTTPLDMASIRASIALTSADAGMVIKKTGFQIVTTKQITTTVNALLLNALNHADKSSLYIEIQPPYSASKKQLRSAIEKATSSGRERQKLLRRIIPVRRVDAVNNQTDCRQLVDDIIYAGDNFRGLGLRIDDASLAHLASCGQRVSLDKKSLKAMLLTM